MRGSTEAEGLESASAMEIDYSSDQLTEVAEVATGEQEADGSEDDSAESENEGTERYRQLCEKLNKKLVSNRLSRWEIKELSHGI